MLASPAITPRPTALRARFPSPAATADVVVHVLVAAWVFAPALWDGRMLYVRDISTYFYPNLVFLGRSLAAGVFPLWCPAVDAGAPFLLVYPPDLLLVAARRRPRGPRPRPGAAHATRLAGGGRPRPVPRAGPGRGDDVRPRVRVVGVHGLGGEPRARCTRLRRGRRWWRSWRLRCASRPGGRPGGPARRRPRPAGLDARRRDRGPDRDRGARSCSWRRVAARGPAALAAAAALAVLLSAPAVLGIASIVKGTQRAAGFAAAEAVAGSLSPVELGRRTPAAVLRRTCTRSPAPGSGDRTYFLGGFPYLLSLYVGAAVLAPGRRRRARSPVAGGRHRQSSSPSARMGRSPGPGQPRGLPHAGEVPVPGHPGRRAARGPRPGSRRPPSCPLGHPAAGARARRARRSLLQRRPRCDGGGPRRHSRPLGDPAAQAVVRDGLARRLPRERPSRPGRGGGGLATGGPSPSGASALAGAGPARRQRRRQPLRARRVLRAAAGGARAARPGAARRAVPRLRVRHRQHAGAAVRPRAPARELGRLAVLPRPPGPLGPRRGPRRAGRRPRRGPHGVGAASSRRSPPASPCPPPSRPSIRGCASPTCAGSFRSRRCPRDLVFERGAAALPEVLAPLRLYELRDPLPRAFFTSGLDVARRPVAATAGRGDARRAPHRHPAARPHAAGLRRAPLGMEPGMAGTARRRHAGRGAARGPPLHRAPHTGWGAGVPPRVPSALVAVVAGAAGAGRHGGAGGAVGVVSLARRRRPATPEERS